MYNYFYRQNPTPELMTQQLPTTPASPTVKLPYSQMQDLISDMVELYHNEIRNMNMYQPLLELSPNMEEEEIIQGIIDHTNNNILYLEQMYLGLTGDSIDKLAMPTEEFPNLSYTELLKNTLFSKTDTLEQYEVLYRLIPIQAYKDMLFQMIIGQLKDATSSNYLISIQTQI
ncbi:MAG TPA: hypothetical protein GX707_18995 [Epulopiscium sp.]|nr:hypothetical protein [Candidatus Epulonipiscium sp.]